MGQVTLLALEYVHTRRSLGLTAYKTSKNERVVLVGFGTVMGNRLLRRLSAKDIERWGEGFTHLRPGTRRSYWSVVHAFFGWCVNRGLIRRSPMAGMKAPRVPRAVHRALDADQAAKLYAAAFDDRDLLILELGLQLAIRRGEIARLQVGDVSFAAGEVHVIGKGGHQRQVPLTIAAGRAIKMYLANRPWISAGPLIRSDLMMHRHFGVSPEWVGRQFYRIATDAGVKVVAYDGVGIHSLRHTALSDVYDRTGDVEIVRDIAGHRSLATTQIYLRGNTTSRLREAMEGRDYRVV